MSPRGAMSSTSSTRQISASLRLSAVINETTAKIRDRDPDELRRPIYLNAVELGYAHAPCALDRILSVRGVTIALFHFIAAGHQVLALLPHCFRMFKDKSTNHEELMALHRMNLVEFTPGYGSEKYEEVNRFAASAAHAGGGCIVARSQMHSIVEEQPELAAVVEKRLLMPSFTGDDLILPLDGPLGRIGVSLAETLICRTSDPDFVRCAPLQLSLEDQRIWLRKLSTLLTENCGRYNIPNYAKGGLAAMHISNGEEEEQDEFAFLPDYARPAQISAPQMIPSSRQSQAVRPCRSTENHERRGISLVNDERWSGCLGAGTLYRIRPKGEMPLASPPRVSPLAPPPSATPPRVSPLAPPPSSAPPRRLSARPAAGPSESPPPAPSLSSPSAPPTSASLEEAQRRLTQLALIIGWERAKSVTDAHPGIKNLNRLADLAYTAEATPPSEAPPTNARAQSPPIGGSEQRTKRRRGGQRNRNGSASTPPSSGSASLSLPSPSVSAVSSLPVLSRPTPAPLHALSPLHDLSSSRRAIPLHAMPAVPGDEQEALEAASFEGNLIDWEAESVQTAEGDEEPAASSPFQPTLLDL